ncbi:MAG: hypothetical protein ACRC41_16925 [Sarcina sp.]
MFGIDIKKIKTTLKLLGLTAVFYLGYYFFFGNITGITDAIMMGIATMPANTLATGFILNHLMNKAERKKIEKQNNLLIGLFYNEFGNSLLDKFVSYDDCITKLEDKILIKPHWNHSDFEKLYETLDENTYCINMDRVNIDELRVMLQENLNLMIELMSNPSLASGDDFTKVIMSILHLKCELNDRLIGDVFDDYEIEHVKKDIEDAYKKLGKTWVIYMYNTQKYYGDFFKKSLITSPFDLRSKYEKDMEYLIKK